MEIGGIVQYQKRLLECGAGLVAAGIKGQGKFRAGGPDGIHPRSHRLVRHLHKVRVWFCKWGQFRLCRFLRSRGRLFRFFFLLGQVDALFLADLGKVLVDAGNHPASSLVNGI